MLSDEVKSLIHLNLMQNVGAKTVQQLVEVFGSAEEALKVSPENIQKELRKIGSDTPTGLVHRELHYELDRELELIDQHDCTIVTLYDEEYPPHLKNIDTPPLVLYVKGTLKPKDKHSISIVGPRASKKYGEQVSFKLGSELAKKGMTIVSGLAKGIDGSAHRGALDVERRTMTRFGIFANNEQPDAWAFYQRQGENKFKQISCSEFEKEVARISLQRSLSWKYR